MDNLKDILGKDIPNVLKAFQDLEKRITPELHKINQHRDEIPSDLLAKFDSAMNDIKEAKEKLKQHGINNN
jgi:hypothetical protein